MLWYMPDEVNAMTTSTYRTCITSTARVLCAQGIDRRYIQDSVNAQVDGGFHKFGQIRYIIMAKHFPIRLVCRYQT